MHFPEVNLNLMDLLKKLCHIQAPSGNEGAMKDFLLSYIEENKKNWKVQPIIVQNEFLMDNFYLVFGKPRTAIFAHIDSIGFTVRYGNELVQIGSPHLENGIRLVGKDGKGQVEVVLKVDDDENLTYEGERELERGTELVFKCDFEEDENYVQSCYLDNRLGVWSSLKVAETLENGIIVFSCWEEHGGGAVSYIAGEIFKNYQVYQALISDITWVTNGVKHGKGVVISMRDRSVPRRKYIDKIISLAGKSGIPYQLEVEESGGSDGAELQRSPYPFQWCFIGAPESNVHSPKERVHKADIDSMVGLYKYLMANL